MSIFNKKEKNASPVEFIVAGLGNPGREYIDTRHNCGFLCIDALSDRYGFNTDKAKFRSLTADVIINAHRCLVMRPATFMNNSGEAVRDAAAFYKVPPENCLIIFDDADLPFGSLRVKRKGSAGSHNGVKSVIYHLSSDNFPRIKIGIGKKPNPDYDLKDFVLGKFSKKELKELEPVFEKACDAIELIVAGDIDKAMQDSQIIVKE